MIRPNRMGVNYSRCLNVNHRFDLRIEEGRENH
jgi:hypothetical protein